MVLVDVNCTIWSRNYRGQIPLALRSRGNSVLFVMDTPLKQHGDVQSTAAFSTIQL